MNRNVDKLLINIEHFILKAYTIYILCQLTCFGVSDVTISQVLFPYFVVGPKGGL